MAKQNTQDVEGVDDKLKAEAAERQSKQAEKEAEFMSGLEKVIGGDTAPVPSDPEQPEGEADAADPEGEPSGDPPASDIDAESIKRALSALHRYKAPKKLIDAATGGDDEAIEYGLHLANMQGDVDKKLEERKELESKLKQLEEAAKHATADTGTEQSSDTGDYSEVVKPLVSRLEELLGEDLSEPMQHAFRSMIETAVKQSKPKDDGSDTITELRQQILDTQLKIERDSLVSEYPSLKDRDTWDRVKKQMETLPDDESRPDLHSKLHHAILIELGPELVANAKRDQRNRNRDNGTPPPAKPDAKKNVSVREAEDSWLRLVAEGATDEQIAEAKSRWQELSNS